MANFFSKIFGASDEVRRQPRRVPDSAEKIPDGDDRWIMSMEFEDASGYNREYLAAAPYKGGILWAVNYYKYSLKEDAKGQQIDKGTVSYCSTPREVVEELRNFEKKCQSDKKKDLTPVEGTRQTHHIFAANHGMHIADSGDIIYVSPDRPILVSAAIPQEKITPLFRTHAEKHRMETWDDLYRHVVDKLPEKKGATLADLQADPAWEKFQEDCMKSLVANLNLLPRYLENREHRLAAAALNDIGHSVVVDAARFGTTDKGWLAQYLSDATILVGVLRAGVHVNSLPIGDNLAVHKDHFKLLEKLGETVKKLCVERLGVSEEKAKAVANIMFQGADPKGPELPIEKIFAQHSAPKAETKPPNLSHSDGFYPD